MTRQDFIIVIISTISFLTGMFFYLRKKNYNKNNYNELRKRLSNMVMGNEKTMIRLVDYERQKNPSKNEVELIQSAIERLSRDRR